MTNTPPEDEGTRVPIDVIVSQELYDDAIRAFRQLIAETRANATMPKTEQAGIIRNANDALSLLLKEKTKYEKACRDAARDSPDAPIDFDAVRSEVGSRLDRIRAARVAEGFS